MSAGCAALPLPSNWAARLRHMAGELHDREAFRFVGASGGSSLTFGSWWSDAGRVAHGLAAAGVGRGDRVAVMAGGSETWPLIQIATSLLGAVVVPVNVRYRADELRHVVRAAQPRVVVAGGRCLDRGLLEALDHEHVAAEVFADSPGAPGAPSRVRPWSDLAAAPGEAVFDDHDGTAPGLLQFTSGTTAFSKGALLTERATLNVAHYMGERIGLAAEDVVFSTQPFYHVGGTVTTTLMPLARGCCMVVPDRYTPESTLRALVEHKCTARYGQGAMYAMELAHEDFEPGMFPHLTKGWGLGPRPLLDRVHDQMGIGGLVQLYGLTECSGVTAVAHHQADLDVRLSTCGPAFPGLELHVDADSGPGELWIRGWSVMAGYVGPDGTVDPGVDADGWFHTGDVGVLDDDGNFRFTDRLKDMIKPGGENVSPAEVERVLLEHQAVAEVCVVGRPDDRLGEVPVAFVRWRAGADVTADELVRFASERMASFKVPRHVIALDRFPMTASGKVQRTELRRHLGPPSSSVVGQSG
jgi:fatty-acyl-CoA synthase